MSSVPTTIAARTVLDVADQIAADEMRLKQKMLACAKARECERLVEALETWLHSPAGEALKRLDPCVEVEVKDKRP